MGDSGSNWLGFVIGLHILFVLDSSNMTLMGRSVDTVKVATAVPLLSALLCFSVPILDTAFVILKRIKAGSHPMRADNRHLHHKLIRLGLTQTQAVVLIYFLSMMAAILGILPVAYPKYNFSWAPPVGLISILTILYLSTRVRWKQNYKNPLRNTLNSTIRPSSKYSRWINQIIHGWERVNKYCLFIILVVTPVFSGAIPDTRGYAALPLLLLIAISAVSRKSRNDFLETLALTLSCILLLVTNNHNYIQVQLLGTNYSIQSLYNFLFFFLFFSSTLFLILTLKRNYLVIVPGDFLLLILPILLILFPDPIKETYRLDIISIRCFIIFLGYKALEQRRVHARHHLIMATFLALIYVAMISIFKMRIIY
jgi:hypothetical protein